ncbi:conserved hypothetical protein [Gloeothece citriformis PCC 7424]|uniref:Uncharacterized protein n=1 Tax=Gloeothece citriformis (strain PCC 7424) TaxID=65393 RepID=B7KIG3_GLOC7|nr:hypothetical protein [Gloeothece citriformis]ACK69369.1 conserved hypothetical protein [Gloeothece citriformis PCC 7424]
MTTYITDEGLKLTANTPVELVEKLQQETSINSNSADRKTAIKITDPEAYIAELIQAGYLRVIDDIDG